MQLNSTRINSQNIFSKSKPSLLSLKTPDNKSESIQQEYFAKLKLLTNSCNRVQKDIANIYSVASKRIKRKLKSIETISEKQDPNWKKEIENFKTSKNKVDKLYMKLKSMSFPELVVKKPIKRMNVQKNIVAPERTRISISEVNSSEGKNFLSKNKRKFGEISVKHNENKSSLVFSELYSTKNAGSMKETARIHTGHNIYEQIQQFPKLALQVRDSKLKLVSKANYSK